MVDEDELDSKLAAFLKRVRGVKVAYDPREASNDESLMFQDIHSSSVEMRQAILDVAANVSTRERSQSSRMRFLERQNSQDEKDPSKLLKLKSCSALVDSEHYVAVSYCWRREQAGWYSTDDEPPLKVVLEDEKEDAIQNMDLVYQDSTHPIAILESCFETQAELDVFASVVDPGFFDFDPDNIEALDDILETFTNDQWFSRAWTLQESISAGVSMSFLIGCPGLDKPEVFGQISDEVEISLWDFQEAMVNARNLIEEGFAQNVWSDTSSAIHASNCADELWNRIPTILPNKLPAIHASRQETSYRQQCNAAQAITFLAERQNSFFPDRLAILANMCNYERRISTRVLEESRSSFSTCALTLAIVNGDMSLLSGYGQTAGLGWYTYQSGIKVKEKVGDYRESGRSLYRETECGSSGQAYGFSWGPIPAGSLSDIGYVEERDTMFRLQPSSLSKDGLKVQGMLWQMDQVITTPKTQAKFARRWASELERQVGETVYADEDRQRRLMYEFTISLLVELIENGFSPVAKTFWQFLQPLGEYKTASGSFQTGRSYSFEDVFEHRLVTCDGSMLPQNLTQDLRMQWSILTLSIDSNLKGFDRPSIHRKLMDQVCRRGKLLCGSCLARSQTSPACELRVWFDDAEHGDLVFTPYTRLGDNVAFTTYQYKAISWSVERMEGLGDVPSHNAKANSSMQIFFKDFRVRLSFTLLKFYDQNGRGSYNCPSAEVSGYLTIPIAEALADAESRPLNVSCRVATTLNPAEVIDGLTSDTKQKFKAAASALRLEVPHIHILAGENEDIAWRTREARWVRDEEGEEGIEASPDPDGSRSPTRCEIAQGVTSNKYDTQNNPNSGLQKYQKMVIQCVECNSSKCSGRRSKLGEPALMMLGCGDYKALYEDY
ncbi:uncharacterized protein KY384_004130 [Bacidia gigantensis]|uniref:uncharacterized protein n=1 Tax=Bacidia gigantensis TaxID=2732470 RepID=UPI001D059476|nr:uncharacterized protein KY384_004130 [Bacidia gigantensis]KAG8530773.1 hypothetical protein KY384_004130 [Bacidia gigantensis]